MRYQSRQYAEALFLALEGKTKVQQSQIIRNFLQLLRRKGDGSKISAILKEFSSLELKSRGLRKVDLEYPEKISNEVKKDIEKILGGKILFRETANPELLAGIKMLVDDELLIDASARGQINKIFSKRKK